MGTIIAFVAGGVVMALVPLVRDWVLTWRENRLQKRLWNDVSKRLR